MRSVALCAVAFLVPSACTAPSTDTGAATPSAPPQPLVRAEYQGVVELEAHLANPGDTVPVPLRWAQTCDGDGVCLSEETMGEGGEAQRIWSTPEATWVEGSETRLSVEAATHHRRLLTLFEGRGGEPEVAVRFTHPRLGATTDRAVHDDAAVAIEFHDGSVAWSGSLALQSTQTVAAWAVPEAPPVAPTPEASLTVVQPGIWDVRLPLLDARSFVVEFETFVVTLEAPWSSAAGEQVVDLIAAQFPDKPIRYALYSHHHPHASGGLRAFIAAGATVVAPRAHTQYLREVIDRDFSLQPDRLHGVSESPSSILFEESFTIAEAGKSLQVIDIGEQSRHTTHYMMVWLPDARVLVQGDLGWFTAEDGEVRVGQRSAGLLEAIDARNLEVETLLQGWPVNSQAPSLPMSTFRDALSRGE